MEKPSKLKLLGLLGFVLSTALSYGDTYDFSYTFSGSGGYPGAGTTVTGSLVGTPVGGVVDVTSVLSLSVDGTSLSGFSLLSDPSGSAFVQGGAVASSDITKNDFGFSTSATFPLAANSEFFQFIPELGTPDAAIGIVEPDLTYNYGTAVDY